jgi:hypothetical protein
MYLWGVTNDGLNTQKKRGRSCSPPECSKIMGPLSPPEFPQRNSVAGFSLLVQASSAEPSKAELPQKPPKKQSKSPKTPSISLRGRNPFSDTQASGDTPKIPQKADPLFECMFRMRNVGAEQVPTIVTSDGPGSTSPGKGEFVTDEGLTKANPWNQRRIMTDSSTEAPGMLPAMTTVKRRTVMVFPRAKGAPQVIGYLFFTGTRH